MFRLIRHADHLFVLISVVFLTWLTVLPFPTAILVRYLEKPTAWPTAIAIYAGGLQAVDVVVARVLPWSDW